MDMGVTDNAILLLGYVAGAISRDGPYELVDADPAEGTQTIRHCGSGNTYRVTIVQLAGQLYAD